MLINALFLPIVILLGVVTSYEDFRYGKIRNKWIISGFILGSVAYAGLFVANYFASVPAISVYYFSLVSANFVEAVFISFFIWKYDFWAAGDAKLFIVYSFLIPLDFYWKSYLPLFPSFVLLINILSLILAYLFIRACFFYSRYVYMLVVKKVDIRVKNPRQKIFLENIKKNFMVWASGLLGILSIFFLFHLLQKQAMAYFSFNPESSQYALLVILLVFARKLTKSLKRSRIMRLIMSIVSLIIFYNLVFHFSETIPLLYQVLKNTVMFGVAFALLKTLLKFHGKNGTRVLMPVGSLQAKMILGPRFLNNIFKKDIEKHTEQFGVLRSEGLDEKQVVLIKKWAAEKNIEEVRILKTFPFAIWMFAGVVLTLLINMSVVKLIMVTFGLK